MNTCRQSVYSLTVDSISSRYILMLNKLVGYISWINEGININKEIEKRKINELYDVVYQGMGRVE